MFFSLLVSKGKRNCFQYPFQLQPEFLLLPCHCLLWFSPFGLVGHSVIFSEIFVFFGRDTLSQGKYEESIKDSTKALELNPNYVKALLRRGEAHEKLEHFEEAIAGTFIFH